MKITLISNQETSTGVTGWFFSLLKAPLPVQVRIVRNSDGREFYKGTLNEGDTIDFLSSAHMFVNPKNGKIEPFDTIFLKSETGQDIEIWSELVKIEQSGGGDGGGSINVENIGAAYNNVPAVQSTNDTVSGLQVLPLRTTRKSAFVQVDGNVFIQSLNGPKVNGSFSWENQQALTLIPESGTVNVRINEDYY